METQGLVCHGLAQLKATKLWIVMPETMSVERRKIIQAYGAELVLTPGSEGMKGAIAKAEAIAAERNGFLPLQFENPANPEVHERTTGQEIVDAFGKDGLDAFVAGVGTGGTVSGISHTLKRIILLSKSMPLRPMNLQSFLAKNLDHIKSKGFQLVLSQIL